MGLITEISQPPKEPPKWSLNSYLLMNALIFALAGICKGFDEGERQPKQTLNRPKTNKIIAKVLMSLILEILIWYNKGPGKLNNTFLDLPN